MAVASLFAGGISAAIAQPLPIFDAHIHYSRPAWEAFSPDAILKILDRGGVRRAFVSSTPDDGTLRLYRRAPGRIVPVLRPYRTPEDMNAWHRNPEILAYLKERIRKGGGIYRGIGEFHMGRGDAGSEVFRRVAALAARKNLFLHAHVDEVALEEILRLAPEVCVLWAHAGMTAEPETVGRLLDRYPNLWVELALRWDVSHSGALIPEWRDRFLRHPDRFLVGTDTWVNNQWEVLPETLDGYRIWLRTLPRGVREKIAHGNAERLAKPQASGKPQAPGPDRPRPRGKT
ncbi:MAG: amidohydrolase family protein [Nitrospinota bacterium]